MSHPRLAKPLGAKNVFLNIAHSVSSYPTVNSMAYLPAHRLRLYRNFKAIDASDHHGIVRYFERYEDAINTLDIPEYFDCALVYTEALFEIGNYRQHIVMCDHLLELVIMQNIDNWGGEDIYFRLLFRKAASLYQQQAYGQSEHILRELLKLHPDDGQVARFLRVSLLRQKPAWLVKTRAMAVGLTFLAAGAVALELFVVRPFFLDYYEKALVVHNILLGAAVATLAGGEFWHGWRCYRQVRQFARTMKARRG